MTLIVTLSKEANVAEAERRFKEADVSFRRFKGLPRQFWVYNFTEQDFPLKDDPLVQVVADGDRPLPMSFAAEPRNYFSIEASNFFKSASWGCARMIRRKAPWNVKNPSYPINSFYYSKRKGVGVDVYIADTGFEGNHPDIADHCSELDGSMGVRNFGSAASYYHGTAVASQVGGYTSGIATGTWLWNARITDPTSGLITLSLVVQALDNVVAHYQSRAGTNRPAVVNGSFGGIWELTDWGQSERDTYNAALDGVIENGIVMTCAAGNNRSNIEPESTTFFPAELDPDIIVCGGSSLLDLPYYINNYGTNFGPTAVDIVAPAQQIRGAYFNDTGDPNFRFASYSGTSMATPMTSAVVACMLEGHRRPVGRAGVQAVKAKLLANATTGALRMSYGMTLPDRLAYLDPNLAFEQIAGVDPL